MAPKYALTSNSNQQQSKKQAKNTAENLNLILEEEDSMLIICYLSSFFSFAFLFLFPMNKYSVGYHKIEAAMQQQQNCIKPDVLKK